MVGETLYDCVDSVVRAEFVPMRFRHKVTGHVYQIEGVDYSLLHPSELLFRAFDLDEHKYVSFNAVHLRLLEKVSTE
jgi:hypothetical protein